MNKQEIEKRFDEEFGDIAAWQRIDGIREGNNGIYYPKSEIKNFIFNEIIPEVLKSVLPEKQPTNMKCEIERAYNCGENLCRERVQNRAKELYNIDLK